MAQSFFQTLNIIKTWTVLVDLVDTLPAGERYTYVFQGKVLDHILVSANLAANAAPEYDIVHVNSEYARKPATTNPRLLA